MPGKQFSIPAYMGHNGWIALDVTKSAKWKEIRSLALFSYRHFALGRMLKALEPEQAKELTQKAQKNKKAQKGKLANEG